MHSKVSVAIPTYNRLAYLKECLRSVMGQTFRDFSVYVFDNASSEPVKEAVKEFGDPRIRFIGSERNTGPTGNINRILRYPFNSEYLIIFHDDDTMHPKILEKEAAFLDVHKEAVFVVSGFRQVSGETIRRFQDLGAEEIPFVVYQNQREFVGAVAKWLRYAFNSAMYRTAFLRSAQMNFERFSDFADVAFLSEMSKKGPCAFLNAPLVNYRMHAQQDSRDMKETYETGAIELLRLYGKILPLHGYAPNFLLRAYASINRGLPDFAVFMRKCRQEKVLRYRDFLFLDTRGAVSLASIILKNKKIIDVARWMRNLLRP